MEYQDIQLTCVTCGREFIFTAKEQEFFHSKGFREPKHCRECRQRRKQERERIYAEASGQPYQTERELFTVTCAHCGRETKVPFKPITGKPVLCKDCFIAQRYGSKPFTEPAPEAGQPEAAEETSGTRPSASQEAIPAGGPDIDLEQLTQPADSSIPESTDKEMAESPEKPTKEAEQAEDGSQKEKPAEEISDEEKTPEPPAETTVSEKPEEPEDSAVVQPEKPAGEKQNKDNKKDDAPE